MSPSGQQYKAALWQALTAVNARVTAVFPGVLNVERKIAQDVAFVAAKKGAMSREARAMGESVELKGRVVACRRDEFVGSIAGVKCGVMIGTRILF